MSKKLSPQQEAISRQAWATYLSAFEARGLPIPELSVAPRMQVKADGTARTVWAKGAAGPWVSIGERLKEYYAMRDAAIGVTLYADVWAKHNAGKRP